METQEIFKEIYGYEGLYQISNLGTVKSSDRQRLGKGGCIRICPGKILKPKINNRGYYQIDLVDKNNICTRFLIHRLVAQAFIDNPNNYNCVNHIDCNKLNNNVNNLEWCTKEYNTSVAWKDGQIKMPKGKNNKMYGKYGKDANKSKPIYQYDLQGNFIKKWDSQKDVERELGFRQNCISNCALGRCKSSYGYVWRLNYE